MGGDGSVLCEDRWTKKAKFTILHSTLPLLGLEPVGGEPLMSVTRGQCDARPTVTYLPSCKAPPPIGWYQIILLGDRGTCVLTTFPGLHSIAERPGFELATY